MIISKKCYEKQWFQIQKHEKYLKSKNDMKRRRGAFNQELWSNFEFELRKFKCYFLLGKRLVIDGKSEIIDGKGVSAPWNVVKFFIVKKNIIKNQWFQVQKLDKSIKSKNALKKPLGDFNQEIWTL